MKNNAHPFTRFVVKPIVKFSIKFFYGRVLTIGGDKVPSRGAVLFTPNHQNALMDALLVITHSPTNPLSLARADVFKNPKIKSILTILHMSPVFRQRDGVDVRTANEAIFEKTTQELTSEGSLLIYPEGTHIGTFQVRTLKKGAARMAIMAAQRSDIPVHIVPMGMNYSNHHHSGAHVVIEYGDPIDVRAMLDEFPSEANAINEITTRTQAAIKQLTTDIPDEGYQEKEDEVRRYAPLRVWDKEEMLSNHRRQIKACNTWKAGEQVEWGKAYHTPNRQVFLKYSPLSYLAYWPIRTLYKRIEPGIKDPQFVSTAKYGFGTILTPILAAIWAALLGSFTDHSWALLWLSVLYLIGANQTLGQMAASKRIK